MRIETMNDTNKAQLAAAIVAAQSLAFYIDDDQEGYASRDAVVKRAKGRVPVLAGTGSNSTAEAMRMTQNARKNGADGSLLVVDSADLSRSLRPAEAPLPLPLP